MPIWLTAEIGIGDNRNYLRMTGKHEQECIIWINFFILSSFGAGYSLQIKSWATQLYIMISVIIVKEHEICRQRPVALSDQHDFEPNDHYAILHYWS